MREIESKAQALTEALCVYRTTKRPVHLLDLQRAVWAMDNAVNAVLDKRTAERLQELHNLFGDANDTAVL